MINYLTELRGFYDWLENHELSTSAIALWHALMYQWNKSRWAEELTPAIGTLIAKTGLSRSAIINARKALVEAGLILVSSRGAQHCASYQMIPFASQCVFLNDTVRADSNTHSAPIYKQNKNKTKQKDYLSPMGEFQNVLLTQEELLKLESRFPDWKDRMESLSAYMETRGVTYKSHYAVILSWAERERKSAGSSKNDALRAAMMKLQGFDKGDDA